MVYACQHPVLGQLRADLTTTSPPFGVPNYLRQVLPFVDPVLGGGEFIYALSPSTDVTGQTISSITFSTTTATVTTAAAHSLLPGDLVNLVGQVPTIYQGVYEVLTVPSTTTFTYALSGTPTGNATTVGTYTNTPITKGDFLELEYSTVSGIRRINYRRWQGTANTGKNLAVAPVSVWANTYFYAQTQGLALAQTTGTPALGDSVYYSGNGAVRPTANAGLQAIGVEYAGTIGENILFPNFNPNASTPSIAVQANPTSALVYLNRPKVQSAIT